MSEILKKGITSIEDFQKTIFNLSVDIKKTGDDLDDIIIPSIESSILFYFILSILFGVIALFASFLISVIGWFKFRVFLHCSWLFFR